METFEITYVPANGTKGAEFIIRIASSGRVVFLEPEKAKAFIVSCLEDMVPTEDDES